MGHKSVLICDTTHFSILLYHRRLPTTTRPDRAALAEKGRTEATPALFAASAANKAGVWGRVCDMVWGIPCPPLMGVAPVQFISAERLRARLRTQTTRGRETRRRQTP